MKILNQLKVAFISKAYTEGIYADTPQNRKLGRVGMSYSAYSNKVNGGSIEQNEIRDFKKESEGGQTVYRAEFDDDKVKVFQSGKKKNRSWVVERNGERVVDENGSTLRFSSANEAVNKVYDVIEEEKSDYRFPAPDYLNFKGIRWINPNDSDTKVNQVHIHKYGKKKPEIVITSKDGYDQTIIVLKNSEMRKLLVGLSKKENVLLKLDYSEDDMQNWPANKNYKSKEITLDYNVNDNTIHYHREPSGIAFKAQDYIFPASALDRVVEQFKK